MVEEKIRQWVIDNQVALPPVAAKDYIGEDRRARDFIPEQLAAEKAAYAAITAAINAASIRTPKEFRLGSLGIAAIFGPVRAAVIMQGMRALANTPIDENTPPQTAALVLAVGLQLEWTAAGAREAPDIGHPQAGVLLDGLVAAGVITSDERIVLEEHRTQPFVVDDMDAWNALHTWIEGRPM